MSKKSAKSRRVAMPLSPLAFPKEERREYAAAIKDLARARAVVPLVFASLLTEQENDAVDLAERLTEQLAGGKEAKQLENVFQKFDTAQATEIDGWTLFDVFYQYANKRARAAYLLGIAIGQQLGPQAFTGGAR